MIERKMGVDCNSMQGHSQALFQPGKCPQGSSLLVFKSLVQSGLLTILGMDQDLDQTGPSQNGLDWDQTNLDQSTLVQSQSIDWSRLVHIKTSLYCMDQSRLVLSCLN